MFFRPVWGRPSLIEEEETAWTSMVDIHQLRILIADDSEVLRDSLRALIGPLAYAEIVAEAETAGEAVRKVKEQAPDVAVLDIEMPGSGIRALKQIKADFPDVHVIMLTNHAGPYYRKVCLQAGADLFLDKSMEFEKVPGMLAEMAKHKDTSLDSALDT